MYSTYVNFFFIYTHSPGKRSRGLYSILGDDEAVPWIIILARTVIKIPDGHSFQFLDSEGIKNCLVERNAITLYLPNKKKPSEAG